jgi:hypothetical protein
MEGTYKTLPQPRLQNKGYKASQLYGAGNTFDFKDAAAHLSTSSVQSLLKLDSSIEGPVKVT